MSGFFLLLLIALSSTNVAAQVVRHDVSCRCSYYDPLPLGQFNEGVDGWVPMDGCNLSLSDGSEMNDGPQEGTASVKVTAEEMPANQWKGVVRVFPQGLDFRGRTLFSFHILAPSARPARKEFARLRLSDGRQVYECQAEYIPSLWRNVMFDLGECPFLHHVQRIEISMMNQTDDLWKDCAFLLDNICVARPMDLHFNIRGSSDAFEGKGGIVGEQDGALRFTFKGQASLSTDKTQHSRNSIYNPPLDRYNTFFIVLENQSDASRLRLCYRTTSHPVWEEAGSKVFDVLPNSPMKAYYVNISDTPNASGDLLDFCLENVDGTSGTWLIDRINVIHEMPIEVYAGRMTSQRATKEWVTLEGEVDAQYLGQFSRLQIYEAPLYRQGHTQTVEELSGQIKECQEAPSVQESEISGYSLLYEGPAQEKFRVRLPNKSSYGPITLLSSRMLAVVSDAQGNFLKLGYFYVDNWLDFGKNPYAFSLPRRVFNVLDYGACGDGFTDDTRAINWAIEACSQAGGGQVVLPGNGERYGRRYIATHIRMQSNVDLHLQQGAVIWQSEERDDYDYDVYYGHDIDIPGVPWTHCLYVNYPLIQADSVENIKITGPGTLRMRDIYTVNPNWGHYARICSDCMHILPISITKCHNVEISDIDIIHSNNYHTSFQFSDHLFVGNLKMYDIKCVSTDGLSFGNGMHHAYVNRAVLHSNDDGIVLSTSYGDPRNTVSPWRRMEADKDHSVRDIVVQHSSICSTHGAGKAVAVIPWGTSNPRIEKQEIDSVEVSDCMLIGGYSVGTWPDNPFDGKPFTNQETDDYSPVKNFYIHDNVYEDPCDLLCVRPTNFRGDTGIRSSSVFQNADFSQERSYWTMQGKAGVSDGKGYVKGGKLYEGLYLTPATYTFTAQATGNGRMVVWDQNHQVLAKQNINQSPSISFQILTEGDYYLGFEGRDAQITKVALQK